MPGVDTSICWRSTTTSFLKEILLRSVLLSYSATKFQIEQFILSLGTTLYCECAVAWREGTNDLTSKRAPSG